MYQVMRMIGTAAIKRKRMSSLDSIRPRPLWFWQLDRIFRDLSHFTSRLLSASESDPPLYTGTTTDALTGVLQWLPGKV